MHSPGKRQIITFIVSASLFLLTFFPAHLAASALTLAWSPNTEDDLGGYKVYYGTRSRDYDSVIDVGDTAYYTVTRLQPQTRYYFALTAYDTSWNESDFSAEVSAVTGDDPDPAPSSNSTLIDNEEGGCFIATAAYGSYLDPHVEILRGFRDEFLIPNSLGRRFVHLYYQYAPRIASNIGEYSSVKFVTRQVLLPLIGIASLSLKTATSRELLLFPCLIFIFTIALSSPLIQAAPPRKSHAPKIWKCSGIREEGKNLTYRNHLIK